MGASVVAARHSISRNRCTGGAGCLSVRVAGTSVPSMMVFSAVPIW
jgi:hypothetical protein